MTKGLLLSKNFTPKTIEEHLSSGLVRNLSGRCSGDTTGYVLEKIGNLMQKNKPYQITVSDIRQELDCTIAEAESLIKDIRVLIHTLGLNHFRTQRTVITYDPWY